ncbi:MAG: tRNA (N6-isopentenyl adenosine(37)-C2)-methylthiotransferase MiaB [Phycisphaerae bacterium]
MNPEFANFASVFCFFCPSDYTSAPMESKKLYIASFGCQMNKLDTGLVENSFRRAGYELVDKEEMADVVLMNTCSVRDNAERKVLSRLGYSKHLKKNGKQLVVGVIGCMAQRLGDDLLKHEEIDLVCGPGQIPELLGMVSKALGGEKKQLNVAEKIRTKPAETAASSLDDFETAYDHEGAGGKSQAFVRVMRGCNNFCSYCIVPYVRGPEVSRKPSQIIEQVRRLAGEGVRQITLLGQTVNSYRHTEEGREYRLHDILEKVAQVDGIEWIKFVTNYPYIDYIDPLFEAMRDIDKVCPYLHIPAQSGSNDILRAMNRNYTVEQYCELVERAREYVPEMAVASDFIVGFPGETDGDFRRTVELVEKIRYKNIFAFKYSPRPGTKTEMRLEDSIPDAVKRERNIELLAVQDAVSAVDNERFVGRTVRVFVEGLSKKPHLNDAGASGNPQLIARTADDYIVVFNGPEKLSGNFVDVRIDKSASLTLFGSL